MADGGHIEVAKAYVTIVPSLEGSQAEISKELTGVTNEAADKAGSESGGKFGEKFAGAIKGATAAIGAAMAAATGAAVATGKAVLDAANDVATYGNDVAKNAQKMNMSTTAYQEWSFILEHSGASIEGMKTSMLKLTKAAEAGDETFQALGISQEELAAMSPEETWNATIAALQNVSDEGERTALANKLLGKGATELAPLFNTSAEAVEEMRQQCHELGGVMSDEALKASEDYQDALQNMNTSLDGLKRNMMSEFLPGITSVMTGLSKVFSGNDGGIEEIQSGLESVIGKITELAPKFFSLAQTLIMSLISGFAPMLPQLVSSVFSVLIQGITTVTSMIPQMMPAIISGMQGVMTALFQALPIIMQGVTDLIMSLVTWLSSGDNVTTFVNGCVQLVSQIAGMLSEVLPVLLPAIVQIISELSLALTTPENVEILLGAVLQIAVAIFEALVNCVPVLIDFVIGMLENLGGLLGDFLIWIVPIVAEWIGKAVDTVKDWLNKCKEFVSNIGNNIKTAFLTWTSNIAQKCLDWQNDIRNKITSWINNIKTTITNWINNIKTAFTNWLNNLKNGFTNAFTFIQNKISDIKNKAQTLVTNLINIIKELPDRVISIGRNLVEGLWNGISDKIQWVKDKISGMGSSIISAIKGVFGIASPSKVFKGIGGFLAEGLGEGYEAGMEDVKKDILANSEALTGSMTAEVKAYGAAGQALWDGATTNNYNGGNVTINVYGAEGQDVNDLANQIAYKLEDIKRRKGQIYA